MYPLLKRIDSFLKQPHVSELPSHFMIYLLLLFHLVVLVYLLETLQFQGVMSQTVRFRSYQSLECVGLQLEKGFELLLAHVFKEETAERLLAHGLYLTDIVESL